MTPPRQVAGDADVGDRNKARKAATGAPADAARGKQAVVHVVDGEVLDLGGERVEVFALPGHTHDSCAYLACGVLFLGDSAAGLYDGKIGPAPPFVSVDREMSQRELRRLARRLQGRAAEISYLAFGHQGPVRGLDPLLAWAGVQLAEP